ncbi:50S ribosomal protein L23 [Candidatus Pacearchaeota archaeon CG10_big_fil_rev_8_21_14_0_10_35_13]|nr:MAG: 50S ribosomal protein L23 [Candidatus Pacearchaeota archaeon CG10_big_fil_rev_8_21_14_0_10_35_13]
MKNIGILFKPVTTEKAVKLIETENTLLFIVDGRKTKKDITREFEELFKVKIVSVNTMNKKNKKYAYIRLKNESPAIDIATKLGMI